MHSQIMARHAAEDAENMVDDEVPAAVEDMRRKRRDADPVVIPTHANVLPTTYHHLAGAYPIYQASVYNPYLSYPLHQVQHNFLSGGCQQQGNWNILKTSCTKSSTNIFSILYNLNALHVEICLA